MKLNKLTPRQALIYDALIPPGMPVRGKELARRTRISERDLRSERKAMQEQGVPIVTGDFGYMLVDESNPEPLLRYANRESPRVRDGTGRCAGVTILLHIRPGRPRTTRTRCGSATGRNMEI